jgi:dihydropteroate synthase
VDDVCRYLETRLAAAREAGVAEAGLAADPGIGFGKTVAHNLRLLAGIGVLVDRLGVPILVGSSRKSFIAKVLRDVGGAGEPPPDDREAGTLATVVWAFEHGVAIVRVHEVADAARAARLVHSVREAA